MEKRIINDYFESKSFEFDEPFCIEEHIEYLKGLKDKYGDVVLVFSRINEDEVELSCFIEREETDEELEIRKKKAEITKAFIRKIELQKLEELKAKYEHS